MFEIILNAPISMFVAMAALTGVAVHDTKVDKLATSLVGVPAAVAATDGGHKLASDPHTHVERVSVENNSQARIMPRSDQKKHLMQKNVPKGGHSFDGYALPIE